MESLPKELPLIDVSPLINQHSTQEDKIRCAGEIDNACRNFGFFRIKGHGVPPEQQVNLDKLSRDFFNLPLEEKTKTAMSLGGAAWRGWFPLGGELTSEKPDQKEGYYFG